MPIEHEARQVHRQDFYTFTHLLASDENNLRNLNSIKPKDATADVKLWGSYLDGKPIADPYYGGMVSRATSWSQNSITQRSHRTGLRRSTINVLSYRMPSWIVCLVHLPTCRSPTLNIFVRFFLRETTVSGCYYSYKCGLLR